MFFFFKYRVLRVNNIGLQVDHKYKREFERGKTPGAMTYRDNRKQKWTFCDKLRFIIWISVLRLDRYKTFIEAKHRNGTEAASTCVLQALWNFHNRSFRTNSLSIQSPSRPTCSYYKLMTEPVITFPVLSLIPLLDTRIQFKCDWLK